MSHEHDYVCPVCNPAASRRRHVRMSLSMPADLVEWVRRRASERGISVSALVAEAIEQRREKDTAPDLRAALDAVRENHTQRDGTRKCNWDEEEWPCSAEQLRSIAGRRR